jgi:carbon-monoxide dehydrogenase small subunit
MLALQVGSRQVRTVEGLGDSSSLNVLQQAFLAEDGGQCGFCTPGFIMSGTALLESNANPTEDEIKAALVGNLCRCNAYGRIIESMKTAASSQSE